jgi:hypothetical protein
MQSATDQMASARILAIAAVIDNHSLFSNTSLATDFVPALIAEIELGWSDPNDWILQNFSKIMTFLMERNLLLEKHTDILHNFFDVKSDLFQPKNRKLFSSQEIQQ